MQEYAGHLPAAQRRVYASADPLPPTSIKPFKEFLNRAFVYRRRATYGSPGADLAEEGKQRQQRLQRCRLQSRRATSRARSWSQIRAYANGFKEQISLINIQRALINEEQRTNDGRSMRSPHPPPKLQILMGAMRSGAINGDYEKAAPA